MKKTKKKAPRIYSGRQACLSSDKPPYTLGKHQEDAIKFCWDRGKEGRGAILDMGIGVGKTITALELAKRVVMTGGNVLFITQSGLDLECLKEAEKFQVPFDVEMLEGSAHEKLTRLKQIPYQDTPRMFVGTYSFLRALGKGVMTQNDLRGVSSFFGLVILDESHNIQNILAAQTISVLSIGENAGVVVCMTGTPFANREYSIFTQAYIADRKLFGGNYKLYQAAWFRSVKNKWVLCPELKDEFYQKLCEITFVAERSVVDLPDLKKEVIYLEMGDILYDRYKKLEKGILSDISKDPTNPKGHGAVIKLIHACVSIFPDYYERALHFNNLCTKRKTLLRLIDEMWADKTDEGDSLPSIIIWTPSVKSQVLIKAALTMHGIKKACIVNGETKRENAKRFVESFTRGGPGDYKILIATPKKLGTGLNLQRAQYAIYYGRTYHMVEDVQSEGRNHRRNSPHIEIRRIDLVYKNTIDELIYKALREKRGVIDTLHQYKKKMLALEKDKVVDSNFGRTSERIKALGGKGGTLLTASAMYAMRLLNSI